VADYFTWTTNTSFNIPAENVQVISPFGAAKPEDLELMGGKLQFKTDASKSVDIFELCAAIT
jgi:hypothetical protein